MEEDKPKPTDSASSEQASSTFVFGSPAPVEERAKQQLHFTEGPGSPTTPFVHTKEPATPTLAPDDTAINYEHFIRDTLLWTNKLRSIIYLMGGLMSIGVVYRMLASSNTLVTGCCYAALSQLALNFVRFFISPDFQRKCSWFDSYYTYATVKQFDRSLKAVAALNDTHMMGDNAHKTLRIGVGLWVLSVLGRFVSAFQLALGLWMLAFTAPVVYTRYQAPVNRVVGAALAQAKAKFSALDRRVRMAATIVPILVAGYILSRADLAIAFFLLLVVLRSTMQQSQVDAFHKRVAPITATASKLGGRFGSYAVATAERYELTPTPAKPKSKLR